MTLLLPGTGVTQTIPQTPEVVDIQFQGNTHLRTSDLLGQTHLHERRLFSKGSFYNRHHLTREEQSLENYYKLHGYLDAVITDSLIFGDDHTIRILFTVNEGKEYYLKDIILSGNTVFSDKKYLKLIGYQTGASFNTFKIRENLSEMLTLYQDNGYPLINIQDSVVVADSVRLFIKVREGPRLKIGRIIISATEHIPVKLIQRELIISQGDLFNLKNIEESKRRLYETSLFNSVNIRQETVDRVAGTIDLKVEVIPAKFRAFDMNMGVKQGYADEAVNADPVLSIGLSGSWYHNNLFDQSRRLRVETKISSIYPAIFIPQKFRLDLYYVEPWLWKFRIPLTINPFFWYIDNKHTQFQNTAYGIRAIMTYRWFRKIKIQSLNEWSRSRSEGTPSSSEEAYEEARKISLKFIWDERNNYFYPQHGFKLVIEPGLVGYFLGGANNYMQLQTSFGSYWSLFKGIVFAHNINFSIAAQQDPAFDIPYEKRFFLGGNSSIRGYAQRTLGPRTHLNDREVPAGGKMRYFSNFELRFPVYSILGGEIFYDIGNLWSEVGQAKFGVFESAYGLGLTIKTPIGPARIDYGIPIGGPSDQNQTHIAIAYAF